jgi:hypothetical protein
LIHDASSWITRVALYLELRTIARLTGCSQIFDGPYWKAAEYNVKSILDRRREIESGKRENPFGKGAAVPKGPIGSLGRLGVREEPGKMRLFAMVDIFTQWVLSPLHLALFDILKRIPQDGTFDQTKPVTRLVKVCKTKGQRHVYSYDLSAATDRLPVVLQMLLLTVFAGKQYAESWRAVLCNREYDLPQIFIKTFGRKYSTVKYAVGQPMGALSSWAMLAITHHAIVQYAAYRAGRKGWFGDYAVLGDDVVIASCEVANQYVRLMKEIGVDIGFHKSIVSSNLSLEFAKRFFYRGEEVTPFPLVGVAVGLLGASFVPEVIRSCEALTGKKTSVFRIAKYLGVGLRAASAAGNRKLIRLPRVLSSPLILLLKPGSYRALPDLWSWLSAKSFGSKLEVDEEGKSKAYDRSYRYIKDEVVPRLQARLSRALSKFQLNLNLPFPPQGEMKRDVREWWKRYIAGDLRVQFLSDMGTIRFMVSKAARHDKPDVSKLNSILMACEKIEKLSAQLPVRVLSTKPRSPLKEGKVEARSRSVKMWRSYRSLLQGESRGSKPR